MCVCGVTHEEDFSGEVRDRFCPLIKETVDIDFSSSEYVDYGQSSDTDIRIVVQLDGGAYGERQARP